MKTKIILSQILFWAIGHAAMAANVESASLAVTFDEQTRGALSGIVSTCGRELGAMKSRIPLFSIEACRADCFTNSVRVSSATATTFKTERMPDGVRLVYGFADGVVEKVICTVQASKGDGKVRWGIRTTARVSGRTSASASSRRRRPARSQGMRSKATR